MSIHGERIERLCFVNGYRETLKEFWLLFCTCTMITKRGARVIPDVTAAADA